MCHLALVLKPLKVDFSGNRLVHSPDPSISTSRNPMTNIANIVHRSTTNAPVSGASVDDLSSLLSRSHPTTHFGRVATGDDHDTDAWAEQRKVHDTKLNPVAASSPLGSNGIVLDDCPPVDVVMNSLALMQPQTQEPWTTGQSPNATLLRVDTVVHPHDWTSIVLPGSSVSLVWPNAVVAPGSHEDLSEGRRRVGEILVRCGVINVPGMSPIDTSGTRPVNTLVMSNVTAERENDGLLMMALADWASEWVYSLVIQPYLQGNFRFQYQEKPGRASNSVALRIRRVLSDVYNPVQVAIHALWFIGILTGNGAHSNAPFLSIPIFRYLHNNGTFIVDDFMFRTFVACAMIGDKTVNDATLSTNTWNRLTRIPQVILNATEKYVLSCLKWNVVMARAQWQDTIIHLRSCIKMGSAFDPFACDESSPSGIMARYLDELINISYADKTYTSPEQGAPAAEILSPQPIRHSTHWEVFSAAEWCPEDDPVINQKLRTMGIAPGADQNLGTLRVGTTAKDLLDSILGSSKVPDPAHFARPAGTSFCGSFGAIGVRLACTVKIAGACQSASWVASHG